jgi:hypothetical protein
MQPMSKQEAKSWVMQRLGANSQTNQLSFTVAESYCQSPHLGIAQIQGYLHTIHFFEDMTNICQVIRDVILCAPGDLEKIVRELLLPLLTDDAPSDIHPTYGYMALAAVTIAMLQATQAILNNRLPEDPAYVQVVNFVDAQLANVVLCNPAWLKEATLSPYIRAQIRGITEKEVAGYCETGKYGWPEGRPLSAMRRIARAQYFELPRMKGLFQGPLEIGIVEAFSSFSFHSSGLRQRLESQAMLGPYHAKVDGVNYQVWHVSPDIARTVVAQHLKRPVEEEFVELSPMMGRLFQVVRIETP